MQGFMEFNESAEHYNSGYSASKSGKSRQDNPYKEGSLAAKYWAKGYEHHKTGKQPEKFTEEKKITVKTKFGGEIPATIKVTSKDYHIVKTASGKQYKVDHQGNSLEESVEDDLLSKYGSDKDKEEVHKRRTKELERQKELAAHRSDIAKHNASASNSQHDTHRNQHDREVQKAKKEHERNMEKVKTDHDHEHRMQTSRQNHDEISQTSRQGHEFTMQHHKQDHERSIAKDQQWHDRMTQSAEHGHKERTQSADHAHDVKKTKISNKHERKMNKEETVIDSYSDYISERFGNDKPSSEKPTHFYGPQRTTAASMRTSDGGYRNQLHVGHKVDKDGNVTHNSRNVGSIYHPKHNPKPDNKPKQEPQRNILGNRVGSKSVKEETDLNESRGFTKPRDHTEIDASEYNEILKARENSGQKNHRQSDIKTDSLTGKVAHTRITHSGGQAFHGIPGVERHHDHATGKSKYYKQNLVKKEELEIDEASRTPEERLAIAKRNYEAKLRSAQYPHERMDAKADYDHFHAAMQKEIAARKQNMSEEIEESFGKGQVTIHSPGHPLHGKTGDVFHRHDNGRVNVQIRHSNRKGDVTNLTLGKDQYKEVTKEAVDDKDLPFTPDVKKTKPSTPGKYGSAYSTVRNLARQAMQKQAEKLKKEELELDEAAYHDADWVEKSARHERLYAYHKRMGNEAEAAKHKAEIDKLYKKEEGGKISIGEEALIEKLDKKEELRAALNRHSQHAIEANRRGDDEAVKVHQGYMNKIKDKMAKLVRNEELVGKQHKLDVDKDGKIEGEDLAKLRKMKEETELQEASDAHKVMVTVSDPNHPAVSQRKEQIMKHVIVRAGDKGDAQAKAESFYKKKGYKVHGSEYHSKQPATSVKTEEVELEEASRKVAGKKYGGSAQKESVDEDKESMLAFMQKYGTKATPIPKKPADWDQVSLNTKAKHWAKAKKRSEGIQTAAKKLAKEESELEETNKGYAPGWMLKADPELAKKVKEKTQGYKDLKKYAGRDIPKKEELDMKTFSQFMEEIQEIEEAKKDDYWDFKDLKEPSHVRKIAGKAYGGAAQKDDEDEDHPVTQKATEKRGRGRPKGSTSGARTAGAAKKSYGGLTFHSLNLPNSNK